MTLFEQILASFGASQVNVNDLPEDDPTSKVGKACESLLTEGVDVLRSLVPNDRVNALARVIWDLIGHKQVLAAIGPDVSTLAFTVMGFKGQPRQGVILIPKQWPQMVTDDPFMQLGAILFVGVQVVDYYNDRLIGDPGTRRRWHAYEAELLRTLRTLLPSWQLNEYQREILERFPDGLDSKDVDLYPYKPYAPAQEDACS